MAKQLYLYTSPFVVVDNPTNRADEMLDFLTEEDRADQDKIHALLLQFAVDQGLVVNQDNVLVTTQQTNTGSWMWVVVWGSFRSLIDYDIYQTVLSALRAAENHPINLVIDLHSRLGTLFDHKLLNTLAHRTITSVKQIPYDVGDPDKEITWETLHKEAPFLWIMMLLQAVVRSSVVVGK